MKIKRNTRYFYFYHNSADIQVVVNDPVLGLKQVKDARCLSHCAAVGALRRSLVSTYQSCP